MRPRKRPCSCRTLASRPDKLSRFQRNRGQSSLVWIYPDILRTSCVDYSGYSTHVANIQPSLCVECWHIRRIAQAIAIFAACRAEFYPVAKRLSADTASSDASAESRAITGPQLVQFFFRRLVSLNFITCQQLRPGHAVHLSRTEDCPSARLSKSDHLRPLSCTKRIRKKIVLTVEQYPALLAELPYHIQVMVMIAMCLGLRISDITALQRQDFDLKGRMLTLPRSIVGRYVWNGGKNRSFRRRSGTGFQS